MKNFLIFLAVGILAWLLRFLLLSLSSSSLKRLENNHKSITALINVILYYFAMSFMLFSYNFFIPFIFFILNMQKTFAWICSLTILTSMIYASIGAVNLAKEHRINYGYKTGFCWAVMFIIDRLNMVIGVSIIKSLFQASYGDAANTLAFDIFTLVIFIADIVLLIVLLKISKPIKVINSNENEKKIVTYNSIQHHSSYNEKDLKKLYNSLKNNEVSSNEKYRLARDFKNRAKENYITANIEQDYNISFKNGSNFFNGYLLCTALDEIREFNVLIFDNSTYQIHMYQGDKLYYINANNIRNTKNNIDIFDYVDNENYIINITAFIADLINKYFNNPDYDIDFHKKIFIRELLYFSQLSVLNSFKKVYHIDIREKEFLSASRYLVGITISFPQPSLLCNEPEKENIKIINKNNQFSKYDIDLLCKILFVAYHWGYTSLSEMISKFDEITAETDKTDYYKFKDICEEYIYKFTNQLTLLRQYEIERTKNYGAKKSGNCDDIKFSLKEPTIFYIM